MSRHFYQFKGEQFEIPTYEETRDFLERESLDKNRKFLDRLNLKNHANEISRHIERQKEK